MALVLSSSVRTPIPGLAISNGLRPAWRCWPRRWPTSSAPRGIRVNGLLPGRVATDRTRARPARRRSGRRRPAAAGRHPARALRPAGRVRPGGGVRALPRRLLHHRHDGDCRRRMVPTLVTVRPSGGRLDGVGLPLELGAVELGVQAAAASSSPCVPRSTTRPAVDHEDLVGVEHGRQPVRDHQRRAAGQRLGQRRCTATSDSESRCAVASSRITMLGRLEQQPGDRQPLLLAAGEPVAAVADDGVEPVGQRARRARRSARPRSAHTARRRWRPAGRSAGWSRIVSWNMCASWVTTPIASRSESWVTSRTSSPPTRTAPERTS